MKHIVKDFMSLSGGHCITTSLKQVFAYYGHNLSEDMLFGLGAGLNCFYAEFKTSPYPLLGMRAKIGEFEQNLARHLNIEIQMHETSSAKKAYSALQELISQNMPVMVYVDMAFLKYLNLPEEAHFGGHSIVVFGIDEDEGVAYISDRDDNHFKITMNPDEVPADFHNVPLKELEQARGSKYKPYPSKNKWVTFDFTTIKPLDRSVILPAIRVNADTMLNPPIKNLGVKGIRFFSERVEKGWQDFDDDKLKWSAFNSYIFINQIGGTGGGGFRKMYGNFLRESGKILTDETLSQIGDKYVAISKEWDQVADQFFHLSDTLDRTALKSIAERIRSFAEKETDLMNQLKKLSE